MILLILAAVAALHLIDGGNPADEFCNLECRDCPACEPR
jgi:hypothetical protein